MTDAHTKNRIKTVIRQGIASGITPGCNVRDQQDPDTKNELNFLTMEVR